MQRGSNATVLIVNFIGFEILFSISFKKRVDFEIFLITLLYFIKLCPTSGFQQCLPYNMFDIISFGTNVCVISIHIWGFAKKKTFYPIHNIPLLCEKWFSRLIICSDKRFHLNNNLQSIPSEPRNPVSFQRFFAARYQFQLVLLNRRARAQ